MSDNRASRRNSDFSTKGGDSAAFRRRRRIIGGVSVGLVIALAAGTAIGIGASSFSGGQSAQAEIALNVFDLPSMPSGYTPKVVLDATTTDEAEKEYNDKAKQLKEAIAKQFSDLKFDESPAQSSKLPNASGKMTQVYSTMSASYSAYDATVSGVRDRERLVDIVNATVKPWGFSSYDPATMTVEDKDGKQQNPLDAEQLNITGSYVGKESVADDDRPGDQYSVQIVDSPAKGDQDAVKTVVVYFLSYPHLKPGAASDFKQKVVSEYEARSGE